MPSQKEKKQTLTSVLPYCQEQKSLLTRIALLSRSMTVLPKFVEVGLLILEYLHLISLDLFLNASIQKPLANSSSELYSTLIVFVKIISPGYFLDLEGKTADVAVIIAVIISILCAIKYALLLYVVVRAILKSQGKKFWIRIWGIVIRTQSKIGYFVATTFWTNIFTSIYRDQLILNENEKVYLTVWCVLMIILEFLLALGIEILFPYCLPTKSLLASKSNRTEIITLIQKISLQIISISQVPQTLATAWIVNIVNLLTHLFKRIIFFKTLPYFRQHALVIFTVMSSAVQSSSLAYLAYTLLRSVFDEDTEINQNFIYLAWIIFTVLLSVGSLSLLRMFLFNLITRWEEHPSELLVHKILIIKGLLKQVQEPTNFVSKYNWSYFLAISSTANLAAVLNLSPETKIDLHSKRGLNDIIRLYLEKLCQLRPKSSFLKLCQAFHFGRKLKQYGLAMSILIDLRCSSPAQAVEMSISLLINEMEEALIADFRIKNEKIDLYAFTQSLKRVTELKEAMVRQADLQANLCFEIIKNNASLAKIYEFSLNLVNQRAKIEKQARSVLTSIPEPHIEPMALCAHYQLVLNHCIENYLKLYKDYNLKQQKYKQSFLADSPCEENTFQRGNIVFVLSGRKESVGSILYCSPEGVECFGRDVTGDKGYTVAIPALHGFFKDALQATLEIGDSMMLGAPVKSFHYHKAGYVSLYHFYMNISPILSNDLYYFCFAREIPNSKEFILLHEDGTIEAATKRLSLELGLLSPQVSGKRNLFHISQISEKLVQANQAFNMIAFPQKYQSEPETTATRDVSIELKDRYSARRDSAMRSRPYKTGLTRSGTYKEGSSITFDNANKIYSIYTTEGKTLNLKAIKNSSNSDLLYNCKIENQQFGSVFIKVISLERIGETKNEAEERIDDQKSPRALLELKSPQLKIRSSRAQSQTVKQSETGFFEEISHIVNDNEKEEGWIDFERFRSPTLKYEVSSPIMTNVPLMNHDVLPSTNRGLLSNDEHSKENYQTTKQISFNSMNPTVQAGQEDTSGDRPEAGHIDFADKHSKATHSSGNMVQLKISKTFHEAIKLKYYPRSYRIFLHLWYFILTAILVNQLRISLTGGSDLRDFETRKNMLMSSNARSNVLPVMHEHIRTLWIIAKNLTPYDLQFGPDVVVAFTFEDFDELRTLNQQLIEISSTIDGDNRQELFEKDIKVFEPNSSTSYLTITNFQMVDRIVETGYEGLTTAYNSLEQAIPDFEFLLRNDLDDLLVKSDSISQVILEYTTNSNQKATTSLKVSLALTVCGIAIMIGFFSVLVYFQYQKDINNLMALLKINRHGIEIMMNRILDFKKTVEDGDYFDEIPSGDITKYYFKEFSKRNFEAKIDVNRDTQYLNHNGVARRFWIYLLQTLILLGIITTVIGVNQKISQTYLTENERRLSQLLFVNNLKLDSSLAFASVMDVMVNPNIGTIVKNNPVALSIPMQLKQLTNYISQVANELKDKDSKYNSIIEEILFDDLCKYIDDPNALSFCLEIQKGSSMGLLEALSEAESFLTTTAGS